MARQRIYFMQESGGGIELRLLDPASGRVSVCGLLGRFVNLGLTVSAGERWALYSQADAVGSDLMIVEKFR